MLPSASTVIVHITGRELTDAAASSAANLAIDAAKNAEGSKDVVAGYKRAAEKIYITCPKCGAQIEGVKKQVAVCEYCGNRMTL